MDHRTWKAKNLFPDSNCQSLAAKLNQAIIPFVLALFFACSPDTVVWQITSVIVDSLDRVQDARLESHVRQEVSEDQPAFANSDSSATVFEEIRGILICAPLNHAHPRTILSGPFTDSIVSMGNAPSVRFSYRHESSRLTALGEVGILQKDQSDG